MSTQTYDFTLTAGGSQVILAEGDYFRIMSSTGPVEVLMSEGSRYGPIGAGQGQKGKLYTRLTVRDRSGSANLGFIMVAGEEFVDNRINGDVSVIDGEKARTLAGMAFSGVALAGVVGGQQPRAQLWNPAGSGMALVVKQVLAGSGFANTIYLQGAVAALANLLGNVPANKLIGGAAGVGQLRSDNLAAAPSGNSLAAMSVVATSVEGYQLTGPVVLAPGTGLVLWGSGAATDLYGTFEFFQQAYP